MKNALWYWTALAALLLLPSPASAQDASHEMERAPCRTPLGLFSVVIRSPSGEPVEDDMTVWIEREGKSPLQVDFGGNTAWFELLGGNRQHPSVCVGTVAFLAGPGQVVVLLDTDDRPAAQSLSAFVYDVAAHTVKSSVFKIAPFIRPLEVAPGREGLLFHSTFQLDSPFQCQGTCPPVNGVAVTKIEQLPLKPWYELRVEKDRLVPRLSLSETRQRESLSPFFKDDRAFGKAISFEPRKNALRAHGYKLALRADGSKCISLSSSAKPHQQPWQCAPAARQ
ncbi:MAG TPA: hypothetical protein VF815_31650 [Myxococcaceae bacterium]|jgi:hypothetical protein